MTQQYTYLFKIVVIGDSGVGKTNLVSQFVEEKFYEEQKPTVGVEFSSKAIQIDGQNVRCQIWDTAGQERFRAVTKAYYTGAVGAVVVFDLTNNKTFLNISKWIEEAQQNTKKDTVVLLVGNKNDLKEREVSQAKIEQLLGKHSNLMLYMETSALNGHNVHHAFRALIEGIFKQKQRQIDELKRGESSPRNMQKIGFNEPQKKTDAGRDNLNIQLRSVSSPSVVKKKKCC